MSILYNNCNLTTGIFSKICRTCLSEGDTKNILHTNYENKQLSELLLECLALQVETDDILPQNMCEACISELIRVNSFIQKCKQSENILKSVLNDEAELNHKIDREDYDNYDTEEEDNMRKTRSGQRVEKESVYKCSTCDTICTSIKELREHKKLANHPKRTNQTCDVCNKTFSGPYLLKQHMRSHTKEKPYICDICNASFSNSSNLRRHKRIHTGERPHVCDICGKAYTQSSVLNEHKFTHTGEKPYVCSYCGKPFRAYANYKTHLIRHKVENGEVPKNEIENHKCNICDRILSTRGSLKTHMLIHGEKMFLCTHCGKEFVNKGGLQSHSRVHSGEKPYKCNFCDKMFGLLGSLKQHELIHTGEKPYPCKLCPKAFVQHHQLQYHLRTHSGERPYMCSYCGKSFALNGNLKVHIRTHTGETPYHCPVCNKGFYDSSSMKKHVKAHGETNYNICVQNV